MASKQFDGAIRLALFLIGIGFVWGIFEYLTTNLEAKAQINAFFLNTEPIVFGVLVVGFFIVYWKISERFAEK